MKKTKETKGITLIALVITIIILLILAGISISMITGQNGILTQTVKSKEQIGVATEKEQIILAYINASLNEDLKNNIDFFEKIVEELNWQNANYVINSISMNITSETGNEYTLTRDGIVLDGRIAYLDIADGTIQLYSNGYKQNGGELQEYQGNYIITGTTKKNTVKVMDVGTYNITIKNLSIDVSSIDYTCAFNANSGGKETDCFVNLTLEGENYLFGGNSAAALGFSNATPNVDGITNGSTLTIKGNGKLEAIGKGYAAGIGSGYNGWEAAAGDANNIIINSGTIIARGGYSGSHGSGIGSSLWHSVNNIVINDGEIYAYGSFYGAGIGATDKAKNIIINGGNVHAYSTYGNAIGGNIVDNIQINGGNVSVSKNFSCVEGGGRIWKGCIGGDGNVFITWGTVVCEIPRNNIFGIYSNNKSICITGGSLQIKNSYNNLLDSIPTDETNNLYLTEIQLENVKNKTNIINFLADDGLNYGIKDLYTTEEGKLYLYLPVGERNITIETKDKIYAGNVETKLSDSQLIILKEST